MLNVVHFFCNALFNYHLQVPNITIIKKVQVGEDQEKAQSEKESHSKWDKLAKQQLLKWNLFEYKTI